jgi:hypothetical protein
MGANERRNRTRHTRIHAIQSTRGDAERVRSLLDRLDSHVYGTRIARSVYHLLAGNMDTAADWVEKPIEERYPGTLLFIYGGPSGQPFRESARWPALAKRMNLPSAR